MAFKVLVVDDSSFYRRRVKDILNEDRALTVVAEAKNGLEAVELAQQLRPDVITMDIEMPVLDGIAAVKRIMQSCPVPIVMFSSLTHEGAQATLDALDAGAADFLPKKFEDIAKDRTEAALILRAKVRMLARRAPLSALRRPASAATARVAKPIAKPALERALPTNAPGKQFLRSTSLLSGNRDSESIASVNQVTRSGKHYQCLAIGTSTGGPVAPSKSANRLT